MNDEGLTFATSLSLLRRSRIPVPTTLMHAEFNILSVFQLECEASPSELAAEGSAASRKCLREA